MNSSWHNTAVYMAMSPDQCDPDAPFYSYREQTRAMLRHLILEQGLQPSHPLVVAYDCHLYMTTAHEELQRVFQQMLVTTDVRALVQACFVGCDLRFSHPNTKVATSLNSDFEVRDKDDGGWLILHNGWTGRGK